jgi:RNA polymerase sigma-70 factor (ECF subfamily)
VVFRRESGRAVAAIARAVRDIDLAEEAVQEAFAVALERWPVEGSPDNPGAWITTTARNRAIDRLRRERRYADKVAALEAEARRSLDDGPRSGTGRHAMDEYPDDRLALMFACCHPALAREAQVALTLRTLGGLTTREIARAFLEPEPTVAQRLSRAKRKIREAAIPIAVPPPDALRDRIGVVLAALYFVFNEGYLATSAETLTRPDLAAEAIRLGRLVVTLLPEEPEALGVLALMLLQDSRRTARTDANGDMVLLADQDRSRWDRVEIEDGVALLGRALALGRPGPYQVQAAIAAVHAEAPTAEETDWTEIVALYDRLLAMTSSPVVALNRAAAVSMRDGPEAGLRLVDDLASDRQLERYHLLHSARGAMLDRIGDHAGAAEAFRRALDLATNPVDRRFLQRRLDEVTRYAR